jgi:predicted XRE-type DNA-binding protein
MIKSIQGFPGYFISDDGRVLSKIGNGNMVGYLKKTAKEMRLKADHNGYNVICLRKDKKRRYLKVARLVAMNFIQNIGNKPQVNHKNGIKNDDRKSNLEWCTASENVKHSYSVLGKIGPRGEKCGTSKLNSKQINLIRHLKKIGTMTQKEIAKIFKVDQSNISHIFSGKTWQLTNS